MPTTTTANRDLTGRLEGVALVAILILVALAAGWASFTHVHDWTMRHVPAQTPDMFGWVNAVISELVPVAALLTIRRRKRAGVSIAYPMFLLIAAAVLSLSAQLAVADASPSGWLLSAVPALAFMALVKLVLAPVKTGAAEDTTAATVASGDAASTDTSWQTSTDSDTTTDAVPSAATEPAPAPAPAPAIVAAPVVTSRPVVPAHLLPTARFAIGQHQQSTGRPITADELGTLLSVTPDIARELLNTITGHTPAINGALVGGAR